MTDRIRLLADIFDVLHDEMRRQASAPYPLEIRQNRVEAVRHAIEAVEMYAGIEQKRVRNRRSIPLYLLRSHRGVKP